MTTEQAINIEEYYINNAETLEYIGGQITNLVSILYFILVAGSLILLILLFYNFLRKFL